MKSMLMGIPARLCRFSANLDTAASSTQDVTIQCSVGLSFSKHRKWPSTSPHAVFLLYGIKFIPGWFSTRGAFFRTFTTIKSSKMEIRFPFRWKRTSIGGFQKIVLILFSATAATLQVFATSATSRCDSNLDLFKNTAIANNGWE